MRLIALDAIDQPLIDELCDLIRVLKGAGLDIPLYNQLTDQQRERLHQISAPEVWERK